MAATEQCPWCGSVISREKFLEIEERIRKEEKRKPDAKEASMRVSLQKELQAETEKKVAKLEAERDAAAQQLRDGQAREAEVRRQAKDEAEKAAAKELQKQIRALDKATAERDTATQKLKDAEAREADIRKRAKEEAEKAASKELEKQRELFEKDRDSALRKKDAEVNRERDAFQKKLTMMERQLQKRTANQLGDGAEIDLYEALRESFPDDKLSRVPKGQNGADIIHDVRYRGQRCGLIVIDSKNRQSWQNGFVSKLREDQIEAEADYAILASNVFPRGKKEMTIESDVIVVSPARVIYIVELLRKFVVSMHVLGLSMKERQDKKEELYKLITSDAYTRRLNEAMRLTGKILDVDVEEQRAHGVVWRNRGVLTKQLACVLRDIDTEVATVVEGSASEAGRVAKEPKLPPAVVQPDQKREAI